MYLIQLILTPGVLTPVIPKAVVPANSRSFSIFQPQNNGANSARMGDSTTSATRGIVIDPPPSAGKAGGSDTLTPALQYSGDLTEFYFFSVGGTTIDILVLD